jgi:hypothetical protein
MLVTPYSGISDKAEKNSDMLHITFYHEENLKIYRSIWNSFNPELSIEVNTPSNVFDIRSRY